MNRVTFTSEGDALVGNLFLPASYTERTKLPLIISGAWLTVKEQMPNLYARRLADRGLAALTFDFRGFGESEGSPRHYGSPARKSADIANAAVFARELPVTEPERIGALGICASGGYDGLVSAPSVTVPTLVVHSDEAVFRTTLADFFSARSAGRRTCFGRRERRRLLRQRPFRRESG